ncbi:hypothetical protein LJ737_04185 [Hymenobacter sp. 15J16-1T3B]|uniref:hypothetical protein n=1 Tax=Hymenobacter sp. 15J16-1T3B TaxID=2886941 RepID=UPI001D12A4E3|nr:hypothetical protein [Hymenobacter sp. 15J16-1T3B]MCC3156421.1 hypothetical protein [Hymenobacter sp. 15J16-1T3B]
MPDLSTIPPPELKTLSTAFWTLLITGAGLFATYAKKLYEDWQAKRQQAKQSNPAFLAERQAALDQYAQHVCERSGCDHVSLYQFHNGQYFTNGDSIQKISMVTEAVCDASLARWKMLSRDLPCSSFPNTLLAASKQARVWLYPGECEDFAANKVLSDRGYTCAVVLLVRGNKGAWVGLVVLSWCEGRQTDDTIDPAALEHHRREFAYKLT